MQTLINALLVGIGGFLGSICRYLVSLLPLSRKYTFPWTTLSVNLIGCFLIALLVRHFIPPDNLRANLLWKTGFCGGFTTFSSFALETQTLLENNHPYLAISYVALSICLGLLLVFLVFSR